MRQCKLSWDLLFLHFIGCFMGPTCKLDGAAVCHISGANKKQKNSARLPRSRPIPGMFLKWYSDTDVGLYDANTTWSVAPSVAARNHCSARRGAKNSCHQCTWRQSFQLAVSVIRPLKFRKLFIFPPRQTAFKTRPLEPERRGWQQTRREISDKKRLHSCLRMNPTTSETSSYLSSQRNLTLRPRCKTLQQSLQTHWLLQGFT